MLTKRDLNEFIGPARFQKPEKSVLKAWREKKKDNTGPEVRKGSQRQLTGPSEWEGSGGSKRGHESTKSPPAREPPPLLAPAGVTL